MFYRLLLFVVITSAVSAQYFTKVTVGPQSNEGGDSRSVSWIDYNNDGYLDLHVTNGSAATANNFLYKNNGNGTFTKITDLWVLQDFGSFDGASWADYDNDGSLDVMAVTWYGQQNSLHRQYKGKFEKITHGDVAAAFSYSETASWGDFNNDGYVDLYVTNSAGPLANFLYRNNGDGTMTKIDAGSATSDGFPSRSADWCDFNNDGKLDLFVANEANNVNTLYWNTGNGTFTRDNSSIFTTDLGNSFGSSVGDIDNDGDFDIFVANNGNQKAFLYRNNGNGTFTKVTDDAAVQQNENSVGSAFGDLDNDGDLDLIVTNAFVNGQLLANRMYRNNGSGSFTRVDTGIIANDLGWSYGVAFGDYDRDGDLDVAMASCYGESLQKNALYRNEGNSNAWLTVKLTGTVSNRSAIGATVKAKATIDGKQVWQLRQVSGQSGYCGQTLESHFGFGAATVIDSLVVKFPSGKTVVQTNVSPKQVLSISEPVPAGYLRAAFVTDSTLGRDRMTVQFSDISVVDPADPVTSWQWDFDNNGSVDATTKDASFLYSAPGTYTVRLRIANGTGADTMIAHQLVRVLRPKSSPVLTSSFPSGADTSIAKNGKVNFRVNIIDTSDSPVTYVWKRNSAVVGSSTNTYSYTSSQFLPAPRVDTFSVTISNDFFSIQRTWLINILNTTSSVREDRMVPTNQLAQNYPNPFNPVTIIEFALEKESNVTMRLYDSVGRELRTLVRGKFGSGRHRIEFDGSDLSSGTYFYKLVSDSFSETKKLILSK